MTCIDAHVHVWDYPRPEEHPEATAIAFTPGEFLAEARPCGVHRALLVQPRRYGTDNSYLLSVIESSRGVFRGVAVVDPESRDLEGRIERLVAAGIRGLRISKASIRSAGEWLSASALDRLCRACESHALAVCALADPEDLAGLASFCEWHPGNLLVIDHLARLGAAGPITEGDVRSLCALARYPHVWVKLSGFYALGDRRPPHRDLVPLIRRVFDAFGPARLLWGSDAPFQMEHESYQDSLDLVRGGLEFLGPGDREWL